MSDEPRLSAASPREFRVTVLLSAEEYIALTHLVQGAGLTQSSYLRMLLKRDMQRAADAVHDATLAPGPDRA